jgi:hypothetical protein
VSRGVVRVEIDGREVEGRAVRLDGDGGRHEVVVTMGAGKRSEA